jgi:4'-phosphopantetheinyl transferase
MSDPAPAPRIVELCWGSVASALPQLAELHRLLDADERRRAERFGPEAARQRFVAAHAMLRHLLAARTGAPPQRLRFAAGPHGKPALIDAPAAAPRFNLAHSGNLAVVALAGDELGTDVEALRPFPRAERFAARFFAPSEQRWLLAKPEAGRGHAALELWTFKEAYLKAVGSGIAMTLAGVEVDPERPALRCVAGVPVAAGEWTLLSARLPGPGVAAVAVRGSGWRLEVREVDWRACRS